MAAGLAQRWVEQAAPAIRPERAGQLLVCRVADFRVRGEVWRGRFDGAEVREPADEVGEQGLIDGRVLINADIGEFAGAVEGDFFNGGQVVESAVPRAAVCGVEAVAGRPGVDESGVDVGVAPGVKPLGSCAEGKFASV